MEFLFGVIIGAIGTWLAAFNSMRSILYKEKLNHYANIQSLATDLYLELGAAYPNLQEMHLSEEKYEKAQFDLRLYILKCSHVIPEDMFIKVMQFATKCKFKDKTKNQAFLLKEYKEIIQIIREESKADPFEQIEDTLLKLIPLKSKKQNKL